MFHLQTLLNSSQGNGYIIIVRDAYTAWEELFQIDNSCLVININNLCQRTEFRLKFHSFSHDSQSITGVILLRFIDYSMSRLRIVTGTGYNHDSPVTGCSFC